MMKRLQILALIFPLLLLLSCAPVSDTVTQVATIDALLAGVYDGHLACGDLLQYGDTGVGTFDKLDGEMVVLDGTVYQVQASGAINTINAKTKTPFACVSFFNPEIAVPVDSGVSFEGFEALIDQTVPNRNVFCVIKATGNFTMMKTRSVPAQTKPYPPLAEASKHQAIFEMQDVSGTIVGFRCPPFVKGVNVPGYHLHFLSNDHSKGGHILGFEMKSGACQIDLCNKFFLILPEDAESFQQADLSTDRTEELNQVEKE